MPMLRPALCLTLILALLASGLLITRRLERRGYDRARAEQALQDRNRTHAATLADDAARRCNLDAACRMRPDAYRRD